MRLGDLFDQLDAAVSRLNHTHRAEPLSNVIEASREEDVNVGGIIVPAASLMPRDIMAAETVALELPIALTEDGDHLDAQLSRSLFGRSSQLRVSWRRVDMPESTALVRTSAELTVATHQIKETCDG